MIPPCEQIPYVLQTSEDYQEKRLRHDLTGVREKDPGMSINEKRK